MVDRDRRPKSTRKPRFRGLHPPVFARSIRPALWTFAAGMILGVLPLAVIMFAPTGWLGPAVPTPYVRPIASASVILFGALQLWLSFRAVHRERKRFAKCRDWPCPQCGHDLFAANEVCPECGSDADRSATVVPAWRQNRYLWRVVAGRSQQARRFFGNPLPINDPS